MRIGCARADFVPGTDDIPVPDEFQAVIANDFLFDTPSGQILTYEAKTGLSPKQVRSFYQSSLVAMGWKQSGTDRYVRGDDILQIIFPKDGYVRLDITLSRLSE